jgi:hypothetical protein
LRKSRDRVKLLFLSFSFKTIGLAFHNYLLLKIPSAGQDEYEKHIFKLDREWNMAIQNICNNVDVANGKARLYHVILWHPRADYKMESSQAQGIFLGLVISGP